MTLSFGVTSLGFILPSQQGLLALVEADEKATINPNVDVSSDSVLGQLNGVFTRQLMIGYEALQVAYGSNDPDVVEGFLQTQLAKLTGTPRLPAIVSQVTLSCDLDIGTVLTAGTTLAAIVSRPDSQWTPKANYTAPFTGVQPVPFVSSLAGPYTADIGTITVITTPVTGWRSVTNDAHAAPGSDVESDEDLRLRREQELQGGGSANVDALRSALLEIIGPAGETITTATVFNNPTDLVDANGLPPHSFQAVIYEAGPPVANDTIAQALWDSGPAGIRSYGSLLGFAVDSNGTSHPIYFSRVAQVPVYLSFSLKTLSGYADAATFKAALSAALNASIPGGANVTPYAAIVATAGLSVNVTGLAMGTAAPALAPSSITTSPVIISALQIANFDPTRITLSVS